MCHYFNIKPPTGIKSLQLSQVDRNYQLKVKKFIESELDDAFVDEISDWLYSFTNYIEYGHEEKHNLQKLYFIIQFERTQKRVHMKLLDFTTEFLRTGFVDRLPMMCHRHFKFNYCGWVDENCFTESENSALARDPLGPKPRYRLHVSADAIIQHTDERFRRLQRDANT